MSERFLNLQTPTELGQYWSDFNTRVNSGKVDPTLAQISQFGFGPTMGNMYKSANTGNGLGVLAAGASAIPAWGYLKAAPKTLFGPSMLNAWGKTAAGTAINRGIGEISDAFSEPLDISFGSPSKNTSATYGRAAK